MGEHQVSDTTSEELRRFVRALLEDVRALERMLDEGWIESDVRRIGAEQEMFLVDRDGNPAPLAMEVLERLDSPAFAVELARFNLEANLTPRDLGGDCLLQMERDLEDLLAKARAAAAELGVDVLLIGILPTLALSDLSLENMVPRQRFRTLNRVMSELRGGEFRTLIKGDDELQVAHDNVMMEACNTSFQIHFQVGPGEFARLYNLAQVVTGPALAAAVNSPVLLHHRLWHETRVALFQQSLDVRSPAQQQMGRRQRVSFGDRWLERSVLEIWREDIARFRVLLATDLEESPLEQIARGQTPSLKALCLHNGTVYRWNRPCYGVSAGKAHLRIENRVLPAGPTVVDEIANAAFYYGLMIAMAEEHADITKVMDFDDAKANFLAAARYGLGAQFRWTNGTSAGARELILGELLPLARQGLALKGIEGAERLLGTLEERVRSGRTGAQWAFDSLSSMSRERSPDARHRALVHATLALQREGRPVHTWELARIEERADWRKVFRTVDQVMTRDVFTVHPEDVIDLAASLMEWEHIRRIPVEDDEGRLVGLLNQRSLIRLLAHGSAQPGGRPLAVREVMKEHPVTVGPKTSILEAIEIMRAERVGCLPVVEGERLVGIVTEHDFIDVASVLLEEKLKA